MKHLFAEMCLRCFLVMMGIAAAQDPNSAIGAFPIAPVVVAATPAPIYSVSIAPVTVTPAPVGITFGPAFTQNISTDAFAFIDGFIAAYLRKVDLNPGRKSCLRENVRKMGNHAVSMVQHLIAMVQGFLPDHPARVSDGMRAIRDITSIASEVETLGDGCVESDTMSVLHTSLSHLKNVTYIQSRFVANSIDILKVVADAAPQIHAGNYEGVGYDVGTVLRKIILSSNDAPMEMILPKGVTKVQVGTKIFDGFLQGFFVNGSNLTVSVAGRNDVNVFIDLHRCIAEEATYFSNSFNTLYLFMAEIATDVERWKLVSEGIPIRRAKNQMDWLVHLSEIMADAPTLMKRCGMTPQQIEDMRVAVYHFNKMHLTLGVPGPVGDRVGAGVEASEKLEEATKYWESSKYELFGQLVGSMLRDTLLAVYPELYTTDKAGTLKHISKAKTSGVWSNSLPVMVAAFAVLSFVGLPFLRVAQMRRHDVSPLLDTEGTDIEALDDDILVE